ncbi:MAG: 50S ribosomal protein L11 methyltransferase [Puia sp.]|nr:50S ribosomal protein L11 methyltransferase [Puia sp.]
MATIQITIVSSDPETTGILIAELSEAGFEGFEEQEDRLLAYIPAEKWQPDVLQVLLAPYSLDYKEEVVAEKNWNEEWERNFQPVEVGSFCAVRASFHSPLPGVRHEIVITPKMSFGTGHHATTYMMIEAMQAIDFDKKTVLDFGTGTGILAILAGKLGAREIMAIDNDDWSISNALENVSENGARAVRVEKMDTLGRLGGFEIILANINKNVIINELDSMMQHLSGDGVILLSGLLQDDFEDIRKLASASRFLVKERLTRAGWICLRLERVTG